MSRILNKKIKKLLAPMYHAMHRFFYTIVAWIVKKRQHRIIKKLTKIYNGHIRKIRVGFLVSENEKWCCQSLFDKLKRHPSFEPIIVLTSLTMDRPLEQLRKKFLDNQRFFQTACDNIIEAYVPKTNTFLPLKSFKLDILFYQQPWNIKKIQNIFTISKFALPCYIPYCFEDGLVMLRRKFYNFHNLLFREYANHSFIERDYVNAGFPQEHIKAVGWPKLEAYLDKTTNQNKKYVIYAPHHSIEPHSIRLGTFAWNGHFMLKYAKEHPEFNWVFKPHPRCKVSFVSEGLFKSRQELEDYYNQWAAIGQVCEQGNYIELFKQTRCLITDCSSFLVEFLPTEQPLIHLRRHDDNGSANIIKRVVDAYYPVFDLEALKHTLHTVLEEGKDPMRQARIDKLKELQLVQPASDNIIQDLEKSFSKD
ncbi:MAG: hypothetical protein J6Y17_02850 [Elusimicrobiaceae bacterium]|nr:hypothetical protein [Elusimicrobiaceae bacterium]